LGERVFHRRAKASFADSDAARFYSKSCIVAFFLGLSTVPYVPLLMAAWIVVAIMFIAFIPEVV
jgi:hypothetical protein